MKLTLVSDNKYLVPAWEAAFAPHAENVTIQLGNILDVKADAYVSPANSFGFMDGGIDLVYRNHFGSDVQTLVQNAIQAHYFGELPVGQSFIVTTGSKDVPYLIVAPTMRVPESIVTRVNVFLAFRAALIAAKVHNANVDAEKAIRTIACPGMGTGTGGLDPSRAALQMLQAYERVMVAGWFPESLKLAQDDGLLMI